MATIRKSAFQDLPPQGGYSAFNYERIPLRGIIKGRTATLILTGISAIGYYLYGLNYKQVRKEILEMKSAHFAIAPLLEAERDRYILKYMRHMREEEAKLMKDYPGWQVGAFFDEPIFKTLSKDTFIEPTLREIQVHSDPNELWEPDTVPILF